MNSVVVNIGSLNMDHVYAVPHFVQGGETLASFALEHFPGGKGLNQSIALARAGARVKHVGRVGPDGAALVELLRAAGVDADAVAQTGSATGHTVIQVTPEGQNCILLFPGANRELDERALDEAVAGSRAGDILLLQNEVNHVAYAMRRGREKGMRIAFNPSPIGPEIAQYPLEAVHWFLLNEIEGQALTQQAGPDAILQGMRERYPGAVTVLTLGGDGVLCADGGETLRHPAYRVPVVDTTAAGDTFTGYFLAAVAGGESTARALALASAASSLAVSRPGAAVSIPLQEEVRRRLAELECGNAP